MRGKHLYRRWKPEAAVVANRDKELLMSGWTNPKNTRQQRLRAVGEATSAGESERSEGSLPDGQRRVSGAPGEIRTSRCGERPNERESGGEI